MHTKSSNDNSSNFELSDQGRKESEETATSPTVASKGCCVVM